ncbi:hypothetical protein [Micromonospora aurantiaca (nom. illeg.)]|uniref:hypothetical protein n=1 Tax=Micromonospora aurantiaca (nom. illeg.) TaxID=47850 RepID=UPI0033ED6923
MTGSGETRHMQGTLDYLRGLERHLTTEMQSKLQLAMAALQGRSVDDQTLAWMARLHQQTQGLACAAGAAADHVAGYHGLMHRAVSSTPETADADWYRGPSMSSPERAAAGSWPTGYDPDQPRDTTGRWTAIGDALGVADHDTCFGSDAVAGAGTNTEIGLMDYGGDAGGPFVSVATPRRRGYNPVTGREGMSNDTYAAPNLNADEAERAAQHLEDLADLAESGYRPPTPTRHTRARQHLQHLLQEAETAAPQEVLYRPWAQELTVHLLAAERTAALPGIRPFAARIQAAVRPNPGGV